MGGSSGGGESRSVEPPRFAWPYANALGDQLTQWMQSSGPQEYYPGQAIANRDPYTLQGQQSMLNGADAFQGFYNNSVLPGAQQLMGAADVLNDPTVQGSLDVIEKRGQQNLRDSLGSIADASIGAGQLGGSRRGVAEGLATSRTNEAIANAQQDYLSKARGQGLEAVSRGLAFAPNTMSMSQFPGQVQQQVGQQNQNYQQMLLDEARNMWNFNQQAPENYLNQNVQRLATLTGTGGLGLTQGPGQDSQMNPWGMALGGIGAGAGMSALGVASVANPYFWPVLAGGAMLGGSIL